MNSKLCENFDDYLDGTFAAGEKAAFESHLADCEECGIAVAQNAAIAGWLKEACAQEERVPTALASRIDGSIRTARKRRIVASLAASCAAVVLIGVIILLALGDNGTDEPKPIVENVPSPEVVAPANETPVQTVADERPPRDDGRNLAPEVGPADQVTVAGDVIAVPIPTERPDVTIYWVYPTMKTADR